MSQKSESASEKVIEPGVLTPSVPWDIGHRSQRQRILNAMASSVAEKSFSATTIADIVGHASISRATFYKHFSNKKECFEATAEGFVDGLRDAADEAAATEGSEAESVRNVTAALLEHLAAKPAYANLLLVEAPNVDPEIVRRYRALFMKFLDSRLSKGTPLAADPEIAFGKAKVLIADRLAAGKVEQLPSLLPEVVYIALVPYLGQQAALRESGIGR